MQSVARPAIMIAALSVTLAAIPASGQAKGVPAESAPSEHGSDEPPLSQETKAHLLSVLREAWQDKDIDQRQYDQSLAWVNASPCRGVDRSLTPQSRRRLELAIASERRRAKVTVYELFRSRGWTVVYTDASAGDSPYFFYAEDPLKGPAPVATWSGAAEIFATTEVADWVKRNARGIPEQLANCFAWHVTLSPE